MVAKTYSLDHATAVAMRVHPLTAELVTSFAEQALKTADTIRSTPTLQEPAL